MTERDAIALTLYGEGRGEPVEGRIAIACVIRNRKHSGRWGTTYESVVKAPYQFSCWNVADPNRLILQRVEGMPTQGGAVYAECQWLADGLLADVLLPRVGTATHYYAMSIVAHPPAWADTGRLVATIGRHRFYAGVA